MKCNTRKGPNFLHNNLPTSKLLTCCHMCSMLAPSITHRHSQSTTDKLQCFTIYLFISVRRCTHFRWFFHLKHVERLTEINKLWNVASCRLCSTNTLAMHGPMNVKHTDIPPIGNINPHLQHTLVNSFIHSFIYSLIENLNTLLLVTQPQDIEFVIKYISPI